MSETNSASTDAGDAPDRPQLFKIQVGVSSSSASVMASQLPTLHEKPVDWVSFEVDLAQMKAATLAWAEDFFPLVAAVPDLVLGSNETVTETVKQAIKETVELQVDPGNSAAHSALLSDLQKLTDIVGHLENAWSVSGAGYGELTQIAGEVENAATRFINLVATTMKKLNVPGSNVSGLVKEVFRYYQLAADKSVDSLPASGSVQFILADLPILADWPVGASNWLPYYPAALTADKPLSPRLEGLPRVTVPSNLDDTDADMAALSAMAELFSEFFSQANAATSAGSALNVRFGHAIKKAVKVMVETRKLAEAEKWQETKVALEAFVTGWIELNEHETDVHFTVQVSDALLNPNMDGRDVKKAIESGTNQPILEFINKQAPAS